MCVYTCECTCIRKSLANFRTGRYSIKKYTLMRTKVYEISLTLAIYFMLSRCLDKVALRTDCDASTSRFLNFLRALCGFDDA